MSGVAALILGKHPEWTPDQVKGALRAGAKNMPQAASLSEGVGEVNAQRAVEMAHPPNPNLALNAFIISDPITGTPAFDATSWASKAKSDAPWAAASWAAASWSSASWAAESWSAASWGPLRGADTAEAAASWAAMSLESASWADDAGDEAPALDAGQIDPAELEVILAGTLDPWKKSGGSPIRGNRSSDPQMGDAP